MDIPYRVELDHGQPPLVRFGKRVQLCCCVRSLGGGDYTRVAIVGREASGKAKAKTAVSPNNKLRERYHVFQENGSVKDGGGIE